jgi:uncharacterized protein with HEPN domain
MSNSASPPAELGVYLRLIIGMRNRLVHGYDIVDYDIVWSTVTQDLPPLIAELEKILSSGP